MSSYDEHLISMAGGDGDVLDQIQRRILDCQTYKFGMFNADKLAHEDAPYLLALVREQRARIERVEAQASRWATLGGGYAYYAKRVRHALKARP